MLSRVFNRALAAGAAVACAVGDADAQCDVFRLGVPDFDQLRADQGGVAGLPSSGLMYCWPTATANWLAYLTNQGYDVGFGTAPRDWQSQAEYNFVTDRILQLGLFMLTSPTEGTHGANWSDGLRRWLETHSDETWILRRDMATRHYAPTGKDIADLARNGMLTVAGIGWYDRVGSVWVRDGGHAVSVMGVFGSCEPTTSAPLLRDPGSSDSRLLQSNFEITGTNWTPVTDNFKYQSGAAFLRQMWRADAYLPGSNGFLDGVYMFSPLYAIVSGLTETEVSIRMPRTPKPWESIDLATRFGSGRLTGMASAIAPHELLAVSQIGLLGGELWSINLADQNATLIDSGFLAPGDVIVGTDHCVYMSEFGGLGKYGRAIGGGYERIGELELVERAQALVFDDDALEVIAVGAERIWFITESMQVRNWSMIPSGAALDGEPSIALHPDTGEMWVTSTDAPAVYRLIGRERAIVGSTEILPGVAEPHDLQFTEEAYLAVSDRGQIKIFDKGPSGWVRVTGHPFDGMTSGPQFELGRSRTALRPEMTGPDDRNIFPLTIPAGTPDCRADLDLNGELNFFDFLAFQDLFAAGDRDADFNFDGRLDFFDFLEYQTAFASGCP